MAENAINIIAKSVGLSVHDASRIISNAPQRYKIYTIPKRRGGERIIAHPSRELKAIQRFILDTFLSKLPISESAMAYVKKKGIHTNAQMHAAGSVILKLDFKDFFHSIRPQDLLVRLDEKQKQDRLLVEVIRRALFWASGTKLCLAIGAPSSPAVSNIVMYELDEAVRAKASELGVVYTRYADDLTFSAETLEPLTAIESFVLQQLNGMQSPKLLLNAEKRGIYTKGMKRMVTGLVLTPEGKVSLGRDRKRMISAAVHRIKARRTVDLNLEHVRGWLALANAVEPDFLEKLRKKYGTIVDGLLGSKFRRFYNRPSRFNVPSS